MKVRSDALEVLSFAHFVASQGLSQFAKRQRHLANIIIPGKQGCHQGLSCADLIT